MNKENITKVKKYFTITFHHSKIINRHNPHKIDGICACIYQSDNVNPQQFYKPISKILEY